MDSSGDRNAAAPESPPGASEPSTDSSRSGTDGANAVPPVPASAPPGRSRRWILAGLAGVLIGGGAGVGAGWLSTRHRHPPLAPKPPLALTEALAAEHRLLAALDASLPAHPELRDELMLLRRDHAAHASALHNALQAAYRKTPAASTTASGTASGAARPPARDRSALRAAETAAASTAARHAAQLTGADATLLASIAACEASHAELLS